MGRVGCFGFHHSLSAYKILNQSVCGSVRVVSCDHILDDCVLILDVVPLLDPGGEVRDRVLFKVFGFEISEWSGSKSSRDTFTIIIVPVLSGESVCDGRRRGWCATPRGTGASKQ